MTENEEQGQNKNIPPYWHWAITCEQIAEIKKGNRTTIDKVYFDNFAKFKNVAYKFCMSHYKKGFINDILQQIYLDLPSYNFSDTRAFYFSFRRTIIDVVYSSLKTFSYDRLLAGTEDLTFEDVLSCEYVPEEQIIEENQKAFDIIDSQKHLTECQKDYLVAVAFGISLKDYKGLYEKAKCYTHSV